MKRTSARHAASLFGARLPGTTAGVSQVLVRHQSTAPAFFSDAKLRSHFVGLPHLNRKSLVEYVWIGGSGQDLRSKIRSLSKTPSRVEEVPAWNYDGSSTGQAEGKNSEITIIPR